MEAFRDRKEEIMGDEDMKYQYPLQVLEGCCFCILTAKSARYEGT